MARIQGNEGLTRPVEGEAVRAAESIARIARAEVELALHALTLNEQKGRLIDYTQIAIGTVSRQLKDQKTKLTKMVSKGKSTDKVQARIDSLTQRKQTLEAYRDAQLYIPLPDLQGTELETVKSHRGYLMFVWALMKYNVNVEAERSFGRRSRYIHANFDIQEDGKGNTLCKGVKLSFSEQKPDYLTLKRAH